MVKISAEIRKNSGLLPKGAYSWLTNPRGFAIINKHYADVLELVDWLA